MARLGGTSPDPGQALAGYERQAQRHAEWEREEIALERLHAQEREVARDVAEWQSRQQSLTQIETTLWEMLGQTNLVGTPEPVDEALARFSEGVERWQQWDKARTAHEAAVSRQDALLALGDFAALAAAWDTLQARLTAARQPYPEWAVLKPDQSPSYYDQQRRQTEQQRLSARETLTRLRDEVQRAGESLRHPAEIEEEIADVKAEIRRLEQFRDALTLASTELSQANQEFQWQFAPKLEALMREGLHHVTAGRYAQARVNATSLAVSLLAPERNDEIGVERLSTGTCDLVYLILRMSIARLMSSTAERLPLLLDDPLVQYDRSRQVRAIDFLVQAAKETQVLFFTKDTEILAQVESLGVDAALWQVHRLE